MTAAELIEKLKELPPDAVILIYDAHDLSDGYFEPDELKKLKPIILNPNNRKLKRTLYDAWELL